MSTKRRRWARRGAAAIELALVAPYLFLLMAGMLEAARLTEIKQVLAAAGREGGRQAAAGRTSAAEVQDVVEGYIRNAGYPAEHVQVTVENQTSPGVDVSDARQFDRLRVSVSMPFEDVRLINMRLLTDAETRVTAESVWLSLKDKPYPAPPEPPIE